MAVRILVAFCLSCLVVPAFAARTLDLYSEQAVLAQNAGQDDQDDAVAEALDRVLVRATGNANVTELEPIVAALENPNRFLSTFRFERSDVTLTNVLGESVPTKRMIMQFDRGAVEQLLIDNGLPVWGGKRPVTLIWLADRLDGDNHILSDSDRAASAEHLKEYANERGIPLTLPLMDLDDTLNVDFTDVYGLFADNLAAASERYQADAVVVGRLSRQGGEYQASFVFQLQDEHRNYQVSAGNRADLMSAVVDQISLRLANQYAVVLDPTLAGQLSLRITSVDNLATLAEVEQYLQSQNLITRVTLRQVEPNAVRFDLEISGSEAQLRDILALDDRLTQADGVLIDSRDNSELLYQWVAASAF
ncbi:DUF2066 domain-containing protein [Saccharospirillum mangrovi]|uniref:DUF2066 domain-containing protein n=1 Tax=Saccharospirillum mangrovi TaxID=2161747 RepID=UPI000D349AE6|nr:DUF2066 domain-containing protein [Saccharospirillum mangrovi]